MRDERAYRLEKVQEVYDRHDRITNDEMTALVLFFGLVLIGLLPVTMLVFILWR